MSRIKHIYNNQVNGMLKIIRIECQKKIEDFFREKIRLSQKC